MNDRQVGKIGQSEYFHSFDPNVSAKSKSQYRALQTGAYVSCSLVNKIGNEIS